MSDSAEKLEILNMIREGKITPEQGVLLIESIEKSEKRPKSPHDSSDPHPGKKESDHRWVNIEIKVKSSSKYKSLSPIRIPMSLVRLFLRFISKYSPIQGSSTSLDGLVEILEKGDPIELFTEGEEGHAIRIIAD